MSPHTTTRRAALTALAAAPLAGTVPIAAQAAGPDPIFAAIARHRQALSAVKKTTAALESVQDTADRITAPITDPDQHWKAHARIVSVLFPEDEDGRHRGHELDAEEAALDALAAIVPPTLPGLLALTAYFAALTTGEGLYDRYPLDLDMGPEIIANMGKAALALTKTEA